VVLVALAVVAPSLANGFAYDDIPVISQNDDVIGSATPAHLLGQPYWVGRLYRPLTIWMWSLEWRVGGGSPLAFHALNAVLAAATALLLLLVARAWMPPWAALLSALLFAVHPVHVEATATGVGQSELLMTVLSLAAVLALQRTVSTGVTALRAAALVMLAIAAPLAKEQGFALPVLLAAVAGVMTVNRQSRISIRVTAELLARTAVAAASVLLWRTAVLGGGVADRPPLVLSGMRDDQRILVVLQLVPQWFRLLVWPARLQAEYGPPGLGVAVLGPAEVLGLALIAAALWLGWWARRRAPVVTLGLLWVAISLLPVSNLIVLTGILLAERTLLLPSAGACLALGGLAALVVPQAGAPVQRALALVFAVLLSVGAWSSAVRARIWRDNDTLFAATVRDAPDSYRAFKMYGKHLAGLGHDSLAEPVFRHAIALWSGDPDSYADLTQLLRRQGRCGEAIPVLTVALREHPDETLLRSRLFECQVQAGTLEAARATADAGIAAGDPTAIKLRHRADSAISAAQSATP
jgi:hypothetical protein